MGTEASGHGKPAIEYQLDLEEYCLIDVAGLFRSCAWQQSHLNLSDSAYTKRAVFETHEQLAKQGQTIGRNCHLERCCRASQSVTHHWVLALSYFSVDHVTKSQVYEYVADI